MSLSGSGTRSDAGRVSNEARSISNEVRGASSVTLGTSRLALDAFLAAFREGSVAAEVRYDALARFEELPVRQVIRGGRTWKHDLTKLDLSQIDPIRGILQQKIVEGPPGDTGIVIYDFDTAARQVPDLFHKTFGRATDTRDDKFASLALAFERGGYFISVPAGVHVDTPIVIEYELRSGSAFPYTLVTLGDGASATIVEVIAAEPVEGVGADPIEVDGARANAGAQLLCGISEFVVGEGARLSYAVDQKAGARSRLIMTRRARLARDATLALATAELGAEHAVTRIRVVEAGPGASSELTGFFFADGDQHVDLETEVVHAAASTTSQTLVRSAGTGRGQGRYLGNIKILKDAHGADASLRDDALLLSSETHIDSVPALEIGANDVRAYHGATVGAISEEEIFYAQSRGLERSEAERMIALGFFEPAIARFPGETLRVALRAALEAKLAPQAVG